MKIFNWVRRRLTHKGGESERNMKIGVRVDTNRSGYDVVGDVFDGWKGGILTIGTFGYDPLVENEIEQGDTSTFYGQEQNKEQLSPEEKEEEEEEANLIMFAACKYEYGGLKMELNNKDEEIDDTIRTKKERTTLAQLFSADSDKAQYSYKGELLTEENNKSNMKHEILSLANQDARPIHKLHKLMGRILKRKIHPDAHGQNLVAKKCETTSEAASLLSTQANYLTSASKTEGTKGDTKTQIQWAGLQKTMIPAMTYLKKDPNSVTSIPVADAII